MRRPCAPVKSFRPNASWLSSSTSPVPHCMKWFNASKPRTCCFVVKEMERLFGAVCGRASATRWSSCCSITLNPSSIRLGPVTRWKVSRLTARRCTAIMKVVIVSANYIRPLNGRNSQTIWTLSPTPSSNTKSPLSRRHTM